MTTKLELLEQLQAEGIIRELCPAGGDNYTHYWHYEVLQPDRLPESLQREFARYGELRW